MSIASWARPKVFHRILIAAWISHPFENVLNYSSCFGKPTHKTKVTRIRAATQNCLQKETEVDVGRIGKRADLEATTSVIWVSWSACARVWLLNAMRSLSSPGCTAALEESWAQRCHGSCTPGEVISSPQRQHSTGWQVALGWFQSSSFRIATVYFVGSFSVSIPAASAFPWQQESVVKTEQVFSFSAPFLEPNLQHSFPEFSPWKGLPDPKCSTKNCFLPTFFLELLNRPCCCIWQISIWQMGSEIFFSVPYFMPERMWQATSHTLVQCSLRYPGNPRKTQGVPRVRNTAHSSMLCFLSKSS